MTLKLDQEELELLASYENDAWTSSKKLQAEHAGYAAIARETLKKDRRVNIRISSRDLEGLQKKALEEGLPYQSLIASVLHKYLQGRLVEKS